MSGGCSGKEDPFRGYLGRQLSIAGRSHVVIDHQLIGHELRFRLRDLESGTEQLLSMLDLLRLDAD